MGKFAQVLEGYNANRNCETVIGEDGFELHWNFLQIRAALQRSDDAKLYAAARKDPRFTGLKNPDCEKDQTAIVNRARKVARGLVVEVGGSPYEIAALHHYLRQEFERLVFGYALERVCLQMNRPTRLDFFAFYFRVAEKIDAVGIEEMVFPEDIIDETSRTITTRDCNTDTEAHISDSVKSVRDIARNLGIWSSRTGFISPPR